MTFWINIVSMLLLATFASINLGIYTKSFNAGVCLFLVMLFFGKVETK